MKLDTKNLKNRKDPKYLKYEKRGLEKVKETTGSEDFDKAYNALKKAESLGLIATELKSYIVVDSLSQLAQAGRLAESKGYEEFMKAIEAGEHKKPLEDGFDYYGVINSAFAGAFEYYWIGPYEYAREVGTINGSDDHLVEIAKDVADNCGYMLMYDNVAVFTRKPVKVELNEEKYWKDGIVSNETGPIMQFIDGDTYYMVNDKVLSKEEFEARL